MIVKKLDENSMGAIPEEVDFFHTTETQDAIVNVDTHEYMTLNPYTDSPYNFRAHSGTKLINLNKMMLLYKMSMQVRDAPTDKDTTPPVWRASTDKDNVSTINGPGSRAFANAILTVNNVQMENTNGMYAYKAAMYEELYHTEAEKKTILQAYGYHFDEDPTNDPTAVLTNTSFVARRDAFTDDKVVEFFVPIYLDFCGQNRPLQTLCEFELELHVSSDKFIAYAPTFEGDVKFTIRGMRLFVPFIELQPGFSLDVEKRVVNEPFRYPMQRSVMKSFFYEKERMEAFQNIDNDMQPRFICVGHVKKDAYHGSYKTNPLYFESFNLVDHRINNHTQNPFVPWQLDFEKGHVMRAFVSLHANSPVDNGITLKMFKNGCCLFPHILTSNKEDDGTFDLVRDGATNLHERFAKEVGGSGITTVTWCRYDTIVFMDQARALRSDLTM